MTQSLFFIKLRSFRGFTLLELVITLTVISILVLGTIPLAQNAAKRQKETRLREELRQMRAAIDEFRRDTIGACPQGVSQNRIPPGGFNNASTDPRTRVVIDDCTIFTTDNIDRYPPNLETLVNGIAVRQRGLNVIGGQGLRNGDRQATDLAQDEPLMKYYLRELPIDPMTGKSDWKFRSSYQGKDEESWDEINIFDVRSASDETGLNGEKYSDW